jgi:hypothetical protein
MGPPRKRNREMTEERIEYRTPSGVWSGWQNLAGLWWLVAGGGDV